MATKQSGVISKWHDDKGFGFIKDEQGDEVFFHISEFQHHSHSRPVVGDKVVFQLGKDKNGRTKASQVQEQKRTQLSSATTRPRLKGRKSQQDAFKSQQSSRLFVGIGFYVVLGVITLMGKLNEMVLGWYVIIGGVTFLTYAKDKAAARNNKWRTPETTLHTLSVLGGWVGAMLAQTYLRHKSKKADFRMVYYLTVIVNLAGLLFLLTGHDFQ